MLDLAMWAHRLHTPEASDQRGVERRGQQGERRFTLHWPAEGPCSLACASTDGLVHKLVQMIEGWMIVEMDSLARVAHKGLLSCVPAQVACQVALL